MNHLMSALYVIQIYEVSSVGRLVSLLYMIIIPWTQLPEYGGGIIAIC